jgi:hypothetical protein
MTAADHDAHAHDSHEHAPAVVMRACGARATSTTCTRDMRTRRTTATMTSTRCRTWLMRVIRMSTDPAAGTTRYRTSSMWTKSMAATGTLPTVTTMTSTGAAAPVRRQSQRKSDVG